MMERVAPLTQKQRGRFSGRFRFLAGLTVALNMESLPWGGIKGKAQSERVKRDPRQSDFTAESSTQRSGAVTPPDRPKRRPGSGQQDREGIGTNSGILLGLVFLCLLLRPSPTSNTNRSYRVLEATSK